MADKPSNQLTKGHHTTLSDIIDQADTVVVFGKIVKDLQPTSQGHGFAQVFGYKRNGTCSKLLSAVVVSLPEPDGPANDCGWDPQEFVKWTLSASFVSTQLHVTSVSLTRALVKDGQGGLTGAQLFSIISSSIQSVTGSTQPLDSSQTLQFYGILAPNLVAQFRTVIASNVFQNGFTLDTNALASMSSTWTIAQLQQAIFHGATPSA